MRQAKLCGMLMLALSMMLGCESDPLDTEPVATVVGPETPVDLGTAPDRARRRMDVDQLRASVVRVTEGVDWVAGTSNQFERFDDTLGVPDYLNTTQEDTAASVLFMKFVDDMARNVCGQLLTRETGEAPEGVFFTTFDPSAETPPTQTQIDENLAYLLLRYHGRRIATSSSELDPWRGLVSRMSAITDEEGNSPSVTDVWRGVCVGLIDHPDFYTY